MAKPETGLDEIKRSRDHYRREVEDQERKLASLRGQIDVIEEKLPGIQLVLNDLNEIIKRLEGEN